MSKGIQLTVMHDGRRVIVGAHRAQWPSQVISEVIRALELPVGAYQLQRPITGQPLRAVPLGDQGVGDGAMLELVSVPSVQRADDSFRTRDAIRAMGKGSA